MPPAAPSGRDRCQQSDEREASRESWGDMDEIVVGSCWQGGAGRRGAQAEEPLVTWHCMNGNGESRVFGGGHRVALLSIRGGRGRLCLYSSAHSYAGDDQIQSGDRNPI